MVDASFGASCILKHCGPRAALASEGTKEAGTVCEVVVLFMREKMRAMAIDVAGAPTLAILLLAARLDANGRGRDGYTPVDTPE